MSIESAARAAIEAGRTALGIELGSTRIKAVLIGPDRTPLATGSHDWDNQFVNRVWAYSLDAVWEGLQACFTSLAADVRARHDLTLASVGSMGVSAMMHGYLAFDADGELLAPFRTWRNTITGPASDELSALFDHNIPQRWSIAHLYQAILNGEEHVGRIAQLTTLAGYVHWRLTGERVLGVGDASGMFPIDIATGGFDAGMLAQFDDLVADRGFGWKAGDILPAVLSAGADAGRLTPAGAALLDPTGTLEAGVPVCPPEGGAGTGMGATNSGARRTGNVAGGDQHLRHGGAGGRALATPRGTRPGDHPGRRPGGHGPLQQRRQRAQRLGRAVRRVRPGAGLGGRAGGGVRGAIQGIPGR